LVVPESAVLYSDEGAYVLAAPPGGHTFARRTIQIGRILDSGHVADLAGDHFGAIVVLSGLREGERVVAGDTFFLDAERRLQVAQGKAAEVTE
jgi:multidrug efflux pump subunit AcrA (membrane-fusion protein)